MAQTIGLITLVVREYDEAIDFYRTKLGFSVLEDKPLTPGKRWVVMAPGGQKTPSLLLAKAATGEQLARVGNQTGGRVCLFLHTSDFARDHREMLARGVRFREAPHREAYGTVAVFEDLYGNKWDLLEPGND